MDVGDGVEDWNSESGEDDGDCERCDDDVDLIETTSPAAGSAKSILHLHCWSVVLTWDHTYFQSPYV